MDKNSNITIVYEQKYIYWDNLYIFVVRLCITCEFLTLHLLKFIRKSWKLPVFNTTKVSYS